LASEANPLPYNGLRAKIRQSPLVWIVTFTVEPKPLSRHFARASTPPSRRGRLVSASGFAKLRRI
jgi:hypothetical protein